MRESPLHAFYFQQNNSTNSEIENQVVFLQLDTIRDNYTATPLLHHTHRLQ